MYNNISLLRNARLGLEDKSHIVPDFGRASVPLKIVIRDSNFKTLSSYPPNTSFEFSVQLIRCTS